MHNIFYIYTINTQNRQTRSRSHTLNAHTSQGRIKQPDDYTNKRRTQAIYIWAKMHKPHNAPSHTIGSLHICGDFEKLHNAFCISILSLFVTALKMFCNLL